MKRVVVSILLCFALACSLCAQSQTYPLRQYLNIRSAVSPSLSPDSSQVAFLTNITGTAQVWKVGREGGWPDQLTLFGSSVNRIAWSPVNEQLAVVADNNGDEQFQIHLLQGDYQPVIALTAYPKVRNEWGGWSRDGKSIFYANNARDPRYFDCYVMDVKARKTRRVFSMDAILAASALSPDGKTLIATEAASNVNSNLYVVDVASGKGQMVTPHEGDANYNVIGFSGDGKTVFLTSDQGRDFVNLAALDVATRKLSFLHSETHDVQTAVLSNDGRLLAYAVNREGYEELAVWDMQRRAPIKLPSLPHGIITPGNFSRDSKTLAIALNTPSYNSDIWLVDIPTCKARQITHSSLAGIDRQTFVEPTMLHYKSFDGRVIPAFLYLPKNAPSDHSLPVILSVHGGPEAQEQPYFSTLYQYLVSRGYAVLAPNIRGSNGYGKSYLALDNGPKRWDALKDLAALVDWTATHPALNPKQVTIYGGSYGGFAVLAMLTHYPQRFAAGVDFFGIADFKSFLANTAPYRRPLRAAEYGDPVKDSEFLDAISPARHADRIVAPLMVVQGANDPRVPPSESEQIVEKVKAKGGTVEYLLFPEEGHGIAKLPDRIKAYETMVAFLDRYVRMR